MLTCKYSVTSFLHIPLFWLLTLGFAIEASPIYSAHYCLNDTVFQPNSTFHSNRNLLLSSLTSNASLPNNGFYRTTIAQYTPDAVSGLFLCRGDVNAAACQVCVAAAAKDILRRCPNQTQSLIWYDVCMLRYSNTSFDNTVPLIGLKSDKNAATIITKLDLFNQLLARLMNELAEKAANSASERKYGTGEVKMRRSERVYGLAQCVDELSSEECNVCLRSGIANLPSCCNGSESARILSPGCNVRYEMYPFYSVTATSLQPRLAPPSSSGKSNVPIIVAIVVSITVLVAFSIIGSFCLQRRRRKNYNTDMQDSFRNELTFKDSLHFDLATIEAATNSFSEEKKIGQGGFGAVYKGALYDGKEIAVKRLSRSSMQAAIEFRNEVALVAQLQHRNLAWKNWTNRTALDMLDPTLRGSCSRNEVIRCIHIALLCVQENSSERPSMASIALMLNSYSVTLSLPRQPTSLVRGRRTPTKFTHELHSDQATSSTIPLE
ncbi:cysteine-rich receptor-like protein kinase 10 [Senna tora]|uniref:Cysteine-rich receptor-like protein kinase 10 n=1 Tax=Senna tora TaxID=362788 RepID=A0A834XAD1_9FABA|nr:cysteine-rich receptor-like protein kinase 10 [Senna tora]